MLQAQLLLLLLLQQAHQGPAHSRPHRDYRLSIGCSQLLLAPRHFHRACLAPVGGSTPAAASAAAGAGAAPVGYGSREADGMLVVMGVWDGLGWVRA